MKRHFFMLLVSVLVLGACGENADTTEEARDKIDAAADSVKAAVNNMTDRDRNFVRDVLKMNNKEMLLLQSGIDNGTDKELKTHAGHMLDDHKKLDTEMRDYVTRKGYEVPSMDNTAENLNASPGKSWDKAWADKMVDEHEKTIRKFEDAQDEVQDTELQTMIMNTLPTLRSHLEMAQGLQAKLK